MNKPENVKLEAPHGVAVKRLVRLHLTTAECNHILFLLEVNERDGWYLPPREQYEACAKRIRQKISVQPNESS